MLIGSENNPKGPSFKKARIIEKNLSGTRLEFLAPPHSDPFSNLGHWEEEPGSLDIFNRNLFKNLEALYKTGERRTFDSLYVARAYSSIWEFRGLPILQGYCGDLVLTIDVNQVDDLPINESLFDNRVLSREIYRAFELAELQDLHTGHSDDPMDLTPYRWPSFLGPINCQWVNQKGLDWLYFEDQPLLKKEQNIKWNIAINDKTYLTCNFSFTRSARNAGNAYRIEERIPRDNFLALMHKIMESLTLKLSPEADARRFEVQAQPGASDKPILVCTPEQVEEAKHILYMWSDREYEDSTKGEDDDHRAEPKDVAAFIDERIKPRPLPNSYPPGDLLKLSPQPVSVETHSTQACAK